MDQSCRAWPGAATAGRGVAGNRFDGVVVAVGSGAALVAACRYPPVGRRSYGPADFQDNFNAWQGSALGLAHTLSQSAFLRPGNTNPRVAGLYYAGSSVRPGIGVPMCMISAEIVLKLVRGDTSAGPLPEPAASTGSTHHLGTAPTGQVDAS